MIGQDKTKCIIELSQTKLKFYIVAYDLQHQKTHFIDLYRAQAQKLIKACDSDFDKLAQNIEFKCDKLKIKDFDKLMQYQLFQTKE